MFLDIPPEVKTLEYRTGLQKTIYNLSVREESSESRLLIGFNSSKLNAFITELQSSTGVELDEILDEVFIEFKYITNGRMRGIFEILNVQEIQESEFFQAKITREHLMRRIRGQDG